jgi:hypothetical protein
MELVKCLIHEVGFRLPSTEKEFQAGELHDQVELCVKHHEEFPNCRFEKTGRKS